MELVTLESVIRQYVNLPTNTNSKGWYSILCPVCSDHGKKGNRAGFKFEEDKVAYHCFNCSHAAVYISGEHKSLPNNMVQVLNDFNVPREEYLQVELTSLATKNFQKTKTKEKPFGSIEPVKLDLPKNFHLLADCDPDNKWTIIANDYLENTRKINPVSYPFMLSTESSDPLSKRWNGRLIIPIYKNSKLIFWQGRALINMQKKYLSPSTPKERIIYGFDQLFTSPDSPLYVVEGWFDAFAINGIALMGNEISETQITWLNRSRREKVYIPDRFGDGQLGANNALELGWKVSTPDIGSCKDVDEAVRKYGILYTMKTIIDNTAIGFAAQTNIGIYCNVKRKTKKNNKKAFKPKR